MEKINNAIKLAMLTNKDDIQKLWMISLSSVQVIYEDSLILKKKFHIEEMQI